MKAIIFRQPRSAMQSGDATTKKWYIKFEREYRQTHDFLMGWSSSKDMAQQVEGHLIFDTQEDAIEFCKINNYPYEVIPYKEIIVKPRSYSLDILQRRQD